MSYNDSVIDPGGMATFNMLHGFSEALVRGYRSGFLKDSDYHHLTQCDSLEVCSCTPSSEIVVVFVLIVLLLCAGY